jgi:hypothetical protein
VGTRLPICECRRRKHEGDSHNRRQNQNPLHTQSSLHVQSVADLSRGVETQSWLRLDPADPPEGFTSIPPKDPVYLALGDGLPP